MKSGVFSIAFAVAVLVGGVFATALEKQQYSVREIADDNFDQLASRGQWILEFYANWCGYCSRFKPVYEQIAHEIHVNHPAVTVGRVNIDENPGLAGRFFVTQLPTIYHLSNQNVRVYEGQLSFDAIVEFVSDNKYLDIEPRNSFYGPFSAVGYFFSLAGFVSALPKKIEVAYGIPAQNVAMVGAGGLVVLMIITTYIAFITAQPGSEATAEGQASTSASQVQAEQSKSQEAKQTSSKAKSEKAD